jgi:hypothetical protein
MSSALDRPRDDARVEIAEEHWMAPAGGVMVRMKGSREAPTD